jgi:hypothetical protein
MSEARKRMTRADSPYAPPEYIAADALAIQALVEGTAEPQQQKRAIDWIVMQASGMYEFNYYKTDRDTSFGLGRAFVGQQIVKLMKINTSKMER